MIQKCIDCGQRTTHKKYLTGIFKYNGERVLKCKSCGHLRNNSSQRINEREMIHIPTQTKKKDMEDSDE
jgi:uncharacterized UBP type Zn finger protein